MHMLAKKLFMLQKLWRDINSEVPETNADKSGNLLKYYFEFIDNPKKLNRLIADFDENGVPLNRPYVDVVGHSMHYYPISIGQYGLAIFHNYLDTQTEDKKALFIRIADWFYNSTTISEVGAVWLTDVPKPEFNVFEPWRSAFSQSRALSILLRAHQLTGDKKYYNRAVEALRPFHLDIAEGGVKVGDSNSVFYEEYVSEYPTRILDGAMFSLFGLYDMVRVSKSKGDEEVVKEAQSLFDLGVKGLKHWLPKFDMGFWVYYNRCEVPDYPKDDPCTIGYLKLVCSQLDVLHKITNEEVLREYKVKFKSYLKLSNILKMYRFKYKALKKLNRL